MMNALGAAISDGLGKRGFPASEKAKETTVPTAGTKLCTKCVISLEAKQFAVVAFVITAGLNQRLPNIAVERTP
jgi:hypothetical protein